MDIILDFDFWQPDTLKSGYSMMIDIGKNEFDISSQVSILHLIKLLRVEYEYFVPMIHTWKNMNFSHG